MNTNQINQAIQVGNDIWYTIDQLSPQMFSVLGCIMAGYILKLLWRLFPKLNSQWIPFILILFVGPLILWLISSGDWDSAIMMHFPQVRQIILGHICGAGAWLVHQVFLKDSWIEKKLFGNGPDPIPPVSSHL